ncbi:MAG: retropepsin-like domain-containing protein [candidate division KSB1 bacterium]|nr:retropepsin-like domain-containing protein [candidate division KSB1 bacterium]MDZ7366816.1 retropepsin-like domain-containing protein [candidate division KSB1 bacterium]MDZ7405177.1 retropepsin-like domain-containing protein [candidate division KSB1 bacterium]
MSIISKEIKLAGHKGNIKLEALFDSGSTFSCVPPAIAEKLGTVIPAVEPIELEIAEKGKKLRVDSKVNLDFWINGYRFSDEFLVVPNLSEEAIIGAKTLQAWRIKLDFENDDLIIDPKAARLRL